MSYFLWVEDFEDRKTDFTASYLFGNILGDQKLSKDKNSLKDELKPAGIYIELNFQNGLAFIKTRLHEIDYVILDIDLMAYNTEVDRINNDVLTLLTQFQDYIKQEDRTKDKALLKEKCAELKKIAGFYLFTELVIERGFPKSHILFFSNQIKNTKSTQDAFKTAKIALPTLYTKGNQEAQEWVKDRYENPYSCLRRGILEGCRYLENLTPDEVRYKEFFKENVNSVTTDDIKSYLKVLENFLPLPEPADKKARYNLFIRTLTHEWESVEPDGRSKLAFVLRNTRHWITHNSPLFDDLNEQMVAYLFFLNMRVLFSFDSDVLKNYEQILLNLFSKDEITAEDFKIQNGTGWHDLNIRIDTAYNELKNKIIFHNKNNIQYPIEDALYFNQLCNNIQRSKSSLRDDKKLFMKLIYQMFWLINSYFTREAIVHFQSYTYKEGTYLFELARHIYQWSFPTQEQND